MEPVEKCAKCGHYKIVDATCMICQLLTSNRIDKATMLRTSAQVIRQQFTPYAFNCKCNGTDPDCRIVLDDAISWNQKDTVERIAKHLEERAKELMKGTRSK